MRPRTRAQSESVAPRARMHGLASDVLRFQRDPIHMALKRATKLQSLTAPELRHAYRTRVREPLGALVANRLDGLLPAKPGRTTVDEILATLEVVNRLDFLVRDLAVGGKGSVVVDMLLDRVGMAVEPQRRAA